MLTPDDFVNLRKMIARAAPFESLDEAQVAVVLDSKIGNILGQIQEAKLQEKVEAKLRETDGNHVPTSD